MGKIKRLFTRKSLKSYFVQYMVFCVMGALAVSLLLSNLCQFGQSHIDAKYHGGLHFRLYHLMDKEENYIEYAVDNPMENIRPNDFLLYDILGVLSVVVYPICFMIAIFAASALFYKRQLYIPITILDEATAKIADNDLDFSIIYDKENELGRLCTSFEMMRIALKNSNLDMWRQVEERKRLNAAFAHDLRTPLTVLKGQSEMLTKYAPQMSAEKIASTAVMMRRHILRLEEYVNTMNDLQSLEEIEINKQSINPGEAIEQISTTGKTICIGKEFVFSDNIADGDKIMLDFGIVMRVYENLLSNAARFAKERVSVSVSMQKDCFQVVVSDDGKGFSDKDLADATKPFYKAVKETDNEHFGMGLNICKILCEKHGGYLKLSNNSGAVVTAVFDCK